MKNPSNKYIEDIIRMKIHKDDKLVEVLMDVLSLGKEAAYRRLRGEVPYTFDDIMKISVRYTISLDEIVGNKTTGTVLANTNIIDINDPITSYKEYLISQIEIFKEVNKRKNGKAHLAFNLIPYVLYSSYQNLNKFRLYRWIHQMDSTVSLPAFKDVEFPKDMWKIHNDTIQEFFKISEINFVFDKSLFLNQVKDILLFVQLDLIDKESLSLLKAELLQLLDDIVQLSNLSPESEIKRSLFVSNVSFETSYLSFEAENFQACGLRLLGISVITTQDPWMCQQQKRWIESLKRYSTLISISGEIDRFTFINQQKEYINLLNT